MKKTTPSSAVFFLFIGVFAVLFFLQPARDFSEKEKRYLTEFPQVSGQALSDGTVQSGFEDWYADHFPLRDLWVGVNAYVKLAEGRNSQQNVYFCADNYLINAPGDTGTEQFALNLSRFEAFGAKTGLPSSMLLVPSPGYVNEKRLPKVHRDYRNDELYAIAAETLDTVSLCDPREALLAANASDPVFYRTDHHLTAYGCHRLYTAWREGQGKTALPAEAFTVTRHGGFYGTTWSASGYWLTPPDDIELWDSGAAVRVTIEDGGKDPVYANSLFFPEHLEGLDKYPVYVDGNHALTTIENPDAAGGTLLVLKDSYAHGVTPFLASDYKKVYLLDLRFYRGMVSSFIREKGVDELLYLYSADTLLTDSNSGWLM